jgi:hypothetical protein
MPIYPIVPTAARLQQQKTDWSYRLFLSEEEPPCEAEEEAAGAEGAEYDGRDSTAAGRGAGAAVGGEYECVGCGAGLLHASAGA